MLFVFQTTISLLLTVQKKGKKSTQSREHLAAQGIKPVPRLLKWIQAEEGAGRMLGLRTNGQVTQ